MTNLQTEKNYNADNKLRQVPDDTWKINRTFLNKVR